MSMYNSRLTLAPDHAIRKHWNVECKETSSTGLLSNNFGFSSISVLLFTLSVNTGYKGVR